MYFFIVSTIIIIITMFFVQWQEKKTQRTIEEKKQQMYSVWCAVHLSGRWGKYERERTLALSRRKKTQESKINRSLKKFIVTCVKIQKILYQLKSRENLLI